MFVFHDLIDEIMEKQPAQPEEVKVSVGKDQSDVTNEKSSMNVEEELANGRLLVTMNGTEKSELDKTEQKADNPLADAVKPNATVDAQKINVDKETIKGKNCVDIENTGHLNL